MDSPFIFYNEVKLVHKNLKNFRKVVNAYEQNYILGGLHIDYISKHDLKFEMTSTEEGFNAGFDIRTPVDIMVGGGQTQCVDTGLVVKIPSGYVGLIFTRSHSAKNGFILLNTPVIDENYCGPNDTIKIHCGMRPGFDLNTIYQAGDRFCQMVILPYLVASSMKAHAADGSDWPYKIDRGGFGTSGVK